MKPGRQQLAEWIDRRHIKQREAAKELGFSENFVSLLLKGKRRPGLDHAVILEDVTGIPVRAWRVSQLSDSEKVVRINRVSR